VLLLPGPLEEPAEHVRLVLLGPLEVRRRDNHGRPSTVVAEEDGQRDDEDKPGDTDRELVEEAGCGHDEIHDRDDDDGRHSVEERAASRREL